MNSILRDYYPEFELYQALRSQLAASLRDDDLRFSPGGDNPTLGALCRGIGETEKSYADSFVTFRCSFDYRHPDPTIAQSVERLAAWYGELDAELKRAVAALSEEDVQNRLVQRGRSGPAWPPLVQLSVYKEALLIFYGKADVYLKALRKPRSEQWQDWIA